MGRLVTFVFGIVVVKWQYDQQQMPLAPVAPQPAGHSSNAGRPAVANVQEIAITVTEQSRQPTMPLPALSSENLATRLDEG
jgi:hypothetical protein